MTAISTVPSTVHLGRVLNMILCDIRNWALLYSRAPDAAEDVTGLNPLLVAELADLAEIIPLQLIHSEESYLESIAASIREFSEKHDFARRYAAALDMSPEEIVRGLVPGLEPN